MDGVNVNDDGPGCSSSASPSSVASPSSLSSSQEESSGSSLSDSEWSNLSAFSCDEGVAAFRSALEAEISGGLSVEDAVCEMFGKFKNDPTVSPIMAALRAHESLHQDLDTLASLCYTVYSLVEEFGDNRPHPPLRGFEKEPVQKHQRHPSDVSPDRAISQNELSGAAIQRVADAILEARNIIVLVGAGVSVSCGIPDFRSEGGLYDLVSRESDFELGDAQVVFDLMEFLSNPETFFRIAKHLMPSPSARPSRTHHFITTLQAQGKLRRVYSQNIDGLECKAGVLQDKLVLCHGSFLSATCTHKSCKVSVPASCIENDVRKGAVPYCGQCLYRRQSESTKKPTRRRPQSSMRKNKRNAWMDDSSDDADEREDDVGVMKPDIVFFGESLPTRVKHCLELDVSHTDLVLVLGTSLKVKPVSLIPDMFHPSVPQFLINLESVSHSFDAELLGNCDIIVDALCRQLGWSLSSSASSLTKIASQIPMPTASSSSAE